LAFTAVNAHRALFYLPQIVCGSAKHRWCARDRFVHAVEVGGQNLLGPLYTGVVKGEVVMVLSFVASVAGCGVTIGLAMWKRRSYCHVRCC